MPASLAVDLCQSFLRIPSPSGGEGALGREEVTTFVEESDCVILLGTILTMTLVLMTGLAVTRERERGTFENLLATPALPIEVMTGKVVPYIVSGQYDQPYAWRKTVTGVLPTSKLALWNIDKQ